MRYFLPLIGHSMNRRRYRPQKKSTMLTPVDSSDLPRFRSLSERTPDPLGLSSFPLHGIGQLPHSPLAITKIKYGLAEFVRVAICPEIIERIRSVHHFPDVIMIPVTVFGQLLGLFPGLPLIFAFPHHHFSPSTPLLG